MPSIYHFRYLRSNSCSLGIHAIFNSPLQHSPNSFSSGVIPRRLESGTGIPSTIAAAYCWFIVRVCVEGGGGVNVWGYISGGFNV